jgi:hypothetical protein
MPASTGPNLGIKYGWALGESGWNTDSDNNLKLLDATVHLSVKDRDLTAPPGSPTAGDRYIVGAAATGDWSGKDGQIALYISGGWAFYEPKIGWLAYIEDEEKLCVYKASGWSAGIAI